MELHLGLKELSIGLALLCLSVSCGAVSPTATELAQCKQWLAENLKPVNGRVSATGKSTQPIAGLDVLMNNGDVLKNGRPDGRAVKIGDKEFKRGVICHAVSKIIVRLPGPGKSFSAVAGVDANAGGGTVIFSVTVGGKTAFKSDVMKGSEPGIPVKVDLGGLREFTILADDAGDGIGSDHADWADAKVTLANGKELWLSDMPVISSRLPERTSSTPPFSFVYDGKPSDTLLPTWEFGESTKKLDEYRTQQTQTYTDPKTGLQVRVVIVSYSDYPTVEWTVYFNNTGSQATPILENIQGLDTEITRTATGEFVLHHAVGSPCRADDYMPLDTAMTPGLEKTITTAGGRSTNSDLCYFNIEWPALRQAQDGSQGVIVALGWPGQWSATFARDNAKGMRVTGGQELTRLKLMPGEEIRTPLTALQFWTGDRPRSQNVWRRWMTAHNMPKPGGKQMVPQYGGCHGNMAPSAAEEIAQIDAMTAEGAQMDHWIIDAGWYPPGGGSWWLTGTWEIDKTRFPKGLREVADKVHSKGMDFIVWFEPERIGDPNSWLAKNHPEWILGGSLLNLGNPEAWKWVTDHVDAMLTEGGIDHYRSDYNIDPLSNWRGNDAEDRQGITENLYVQGFLAFWDELLRRHPNMYIDTCASGGRRNDIETLRRSVPLLRSDYPLTDFTIGSAHGQQAQTYGISYWIPYFGTGEPATDMYTIRSGYSPAYRIGYNALDPKGMTKWYHQGIDETRMLFPYWLGDYYPLTPYSLEKNVWIAWQFDAPENNGGFIQAFRRQDNTEAAVLFKLQGLEPESSYLLTNLDKCTTDKMTGRELMDKGMQISIADQPGSALIIYKKVK